MNDQLLERRGWWWLPSTPDRKVAGTLRTSESGRISLDLIGSLRPPFSGGERSTVNGVTTITHTRASDEADGRYPRILGEAGGKRITLDDCFQTSHHSNLLRDSAEEAVHVHRAFLGVWLDDDEPLAFQKVSVRMDWFVYWIAQSGISRPMEFRRTETGGLQPIAAELRAAPLGVVASVRAPEGLTVSIEHTLESGGDSAAEIHLNQDFILHVEAETAVDLDQLMKIVSAVQALVSIGVDRPASFRALQVFHPDVRNAGSTSLLPIEYLGHWQLRPAAQMETLRGTDMPFTLTQLGGEAGLTSALEVALRHQSTLDRVMSSKLSETMYPSDRLLNVVASLEGYHRTRRREGTFPPTEKNKLKDKLRTCVTSMGVPAKAVVNQPDILVNRLNSARQDVAHHYSTTDEQALGQYYLARAGYFIYVLCLLHEAGVSTDVLAHVLDRQRALFDRWKIEQALAGELT